jgi:CubicO group peptidase (beta-lactamase class C family)
LPDGWHVATPAQEGLDPTPICSIAASLQGTNPDGVVVVRHNTLVYEHYFTDGTTYGPDSVHSLYSVTKSVIGLLIGIAFDRGWLRDGDAPISSFFPGDIDLLTQGKSAITLRNLLTMTSGLQWPEMTVSYADPSNIERQMNTKANVTRFVLSQPLSVTPGTIWNYDSGGVEVLGNILTDVAHEPFDMLAQQALFDPLGIAHRAWLSSSGKNLGASWGLWLTPRDLAKIGQLVLNHGSWNGQQIVSAQWISDMVAPHVSLPEHFLHGGDGGYAYGYLWWLGRTHIGDRRIDWIAGIGWGGQRLYLVPSLDLVIVVTANETNPNSPQAGYTVLETVLHAAG